MNIGTFGDAERHFNAERNAEVVVSAQQFDAKRLTEPDVTWSVRDQHTGQGVLKLRQDLELKLRQGRGRRAHRGPGPQQPRSAG